MFSASLVLWGLNVEVKLQILKIRNKTIKTSLVHSLDVTDELFSVSINVLWYDHLCFQYILHAFERITGTSNIRSITQDLYYKSQ